MDHSNALKPMPSLRAYQIPCSELGPVHSYALAGRQSSMRDRRALSRGRRSTLPLAVTRAARGDPAILDRAHLHLFCRRLHAFIARQRPPQPAFCSRPSCSPGHWSSVLSLLSLQMLHAAVAAAADGGRRFRASSGQAPLSDASSVSGRKISAPAAGQRQSWRPPDGAAGAMCGWLSYRVWGYFLRGPVRLSGQKLSNFFLLQILIDLNELILTVQTVLKVLHSFDFSLAVDELGAPRFVHP